MHMRSLLTLCLLLTSFWVLAQVTVTPMFPTADEEITIVYDATQGTTGLVGASAVMMHSGTILSGESGTEWTNVKGTWGDPGSPGQMTNLGNNKWQIKIIPRTYFGVAADVRIYRIGMVFRSAGPCGGFAGNATDCKEGKSPGNGNIVVDLFDDDQYIVAFSRPSSFPVFKNQGEQISITADASAESDLIISVNGIQVATATDATSISYTHTITEGSGSSIVTVAGDNGTEVVEKSFEYIIRTATVTQPRPVGIVDGINYPADATKVILSLWAPGKTSVYVVGDFNDWKVSPDYQLKKDGEHFWIELGGLTPGEEYGFNYLVNESIRIADPYADKILDPDDQYIPESIYPDLKIFPDAARTDKRYFNRVSVLQTNQSQYEWQVENFEKPSRDKLVIYELLIRDFFAAENRSYQSLIDTLGYFKRLGVNAIQLMPVMEFEGNDSWGYNPTFMFAPDKAYGPKNKLKQFIDECHLQGIAVIFDIAMNHHDMPNPYVLLDFDFVSLKPTANNKWFNVEAKHPYNVFFDMNHESAYTKAYLDTVNYYWLNEYKIDGYRFDLTKGFTQNARCGGSRTDETCIAQKDQSRIDILTRMGNKIWEHSPDAFIILEHFAANDEETVLINNGFMVWGNLNYAYSQNSKGTSGSSDISWIYHKSRGWTEKGVVGYMESHDEERMMYRNLQEGGTSGTYSVKDLATGLDRVKAAATMFYTIPGPKMLWQFGELGYDISINFIDRVAAKPVKWEYYNDPDRRALLDHVTDLIRLRNTYPVFTQGDVTFAGNTTLLKQLTIKGSPYVANPDTPEEMNVHVVINFDLISKNVSVAFPHVGTWYDYYKESEPVVVTSALKSITLLPGEYKLFTDVPLHELPPVGTEGNVLASVMIFPNPVTNKLKVVGGENCMVHLYDATGNSHALIQDEENVYDLSTLPSGLYFIQIRHSDGAVWVKKIIKL
jgi:1,4-alpha-glucan branching enzyme